MTEINEECVRSKKECVNATPLKEMSASFGETIDGALHLVKLFTSL